MYQIRMHYSTKNIIMEERADLVSHWVSGTDVVIDADTQEDASAILSLAEANTKLPLSRPYQL